jgi:hypothetical protein
VRGKIEATANKTFAVLIENCRLKHGVEFDDAEDLKTQLLPVAKIPQLVAAGKIKHPQVIFTLHFLNCGSRASRKADAVSTAIFLPPGEDFNVPSVFENTRVGISWTRHRKNRRRGRLFLLLGEKARLRASDDSPNKINWFGTLERSPAGQ